MNDNRRYDWTDRAHSERPEYAIIERWIPPRSRVIDLGCGNGSLLRLLKERKDVAEFGIELAPSGVELCRQQALRVRQGSIDVDLTDLAADEFDYAVCNVTLQMVMNPEVTLREMRRIARFQIVSFPNFAFYWNRLELLALGRMPRRLLFGYDWYDTGHIHQLSIRDFTGTIRKLALQPRDAAYLGHTGPLSRLWPNLLASEAVFLLERA
ncbi:MAG: methyltransferase domain-containing protein [Deltaproteobacteria bacterium]|nr:methyltransferase domain-containing protein [Deltaproteobacteria bacterium]